MEFDRIINRMEELVSSSFDSSYFSHLTDVQWKPPLDVYESEDYILVVMEMAGIRPEDINVLVRGGEVSISGTRENILPASSNYTCHHMEMPCGRFYRKISLYPAVTGTAEVTYESGLLKIIIHKEKK